MEYPASVRNYLEKNSMNPNKLRYMLTTIDGRIIDVGTLTDVFIIVPVEGEKICDFVPALSGYFPLKKTLYLPNVQLFHQYYFNIHLLKDEQRVWVLSQNVSQRIESMQGVVSPIPSTYDEECSLLEAMNYLVLKNTETGHFLVKTNVPLWVSGLFVVDRPELVLDECFPFLASVIDQLPKNESIDKSLKSYSGIWTQNTTDGHEMHLNAWALQTSKEITLLIRPVDMGTLTDKNVIQLARENSLAYEQLQKAKLKMQQLLNLKDQFVNIISHDFRSPISTLVDGVSFLLEDIENDQPFDQEHVEIIVQLKNELLRLLDYNNKLYNCTRMNLDAFELNISEVSLDDLVLNMLAHFENRLKEKKIEMIPVLRKSVYLQTDIVLLSQVFLNLIDNAIKYSKSDSQIEFVVDESFVKIVDHGVGIPDSKLDEINQGYSLKSTPGTEGEKGTGLGLGIVSRIVSALNYKLVVDSELNKGTTFTIKLKP